MTQFRDYAFFRLGKEYKGDGRIPLDIHSNIGVTELCQATPATGAFPVGLAYRKLVRKKKYIFDNFDLICKTPNAKLAEETAAGNNNDNESDFVSYHVDGGMLNNEPFDLTLKLMARIQKEEIQEDKIKLPQATSTVEKLDNNEESFDATIIMIDPFPSLDSVSVIDAGPVEQKKLAKEDNKEGFQNFPFSIMQVIGKIYKTMRGELLFKGDDIIAAFNNKNFSRFLIAPKRKDDQKIKDGKIYEGSVAIACGSLDGFGGFFDKKFREHDFYLGRINCQSFLNRHFIIRLDENNKPVNPIFAEGYTAEAIEEFKFIGEDNNWYVPIIPDIRFDAQGKPKANKERENPIPFPVYDMNNFDAYKKDIQNRIKAVAGNVIPSGVLLTAFNTLFFFKKGAWVKQIKGIVENGFKTWGIVK